MARACARVPHAQLLHARCERPLLGRRAGGGEGLWAAGLAHRRGAQHFAAAAPGGAEGGEGVENGSEGENGVGEEGGEAQGGARGGARRRGMQTYGAPQGAQVKQAGARALAAAGAAAGVDEREEESEPGRTSFVAETQLPTDAGNFRVRAYRHTVGGETREDLAILVGEVGGLEEVPVRVHDACFTGEVLGSLKCDCAQQLQLALTYIRDNGPGIVLYLQQEGRGIGLANKVRACGRARQPDAARREMAAVHALRPAGWCENAREGGCVSLF